MPLTQSVDEGEDVQDKTHTQMVLRDLMNLKLRA